MALALGRLPPRWFNRSVASDYRLSQPLIARLLGISLAALGLLVLLLTLVVGLLRLSAGVLGAGLVLAVAAFLAVGFVLLRGTPVVRLDDTGYRVRFIRGAGVSRGRWADVEDVVATTMDDERCVVLRLRDGRTTTVPVDALAGSADSFVRDLQEHLDRGHGYRRIT
jgi:hypothetical protein